MSLGTKNRISDFVVLLLLLFSGSLVGAWNVTKPNVLQLGLMSFKDSTEPIFVAVDAARNLAATLINNQTEILPNHQIEFVFKEETGDVGVAFLGALELAGIEARPGSGETAIHVPLVFGATLSSTSQAAVSSGQFFGTVYISTTATSLSLTDRDKYPTFTRVCPNDGLQAEVLAKFAYDRGWRIMGTFFTTGIYQSGLATAFHAAFETLGGTVAISQSFAEEATRSGPADIKAQVSALKSSGVLIFFIAMLWDDFESAVDEFRIQGMLGPPYVFLGPDSLTRNFNLTELNGFLTTAPGINPNTTEYQTMYSNWQHIYETDPEVVFNRSADTLENFAAYGYDSVYVTAKAATRYFELQDFCADTPQPPWPPEFIEWYGNDSTSCQRFNATIMEKSLYQLMRNVSFNGASGLVEFDSISERKHADWDILNRQGNEWVKVGFGTVENVRLLTPVIWPDGTTTTPLDHLPAPVYSALVGQSKAGYLVFAGLLLAVILVLLVTVTLLRNSRAMKSASPKLLVVTLLGSLAIVIAGVLHSIAQTPAICIAKLWLFHLGFTTAIGSLLLTLFRLYKVFNNHKLESLDNLRDKNLLFYLGCMLCVEVIFLVAWSAYDPFVIDEVDRCSSSNGVEIIFPFMATTKAVLLASAGVLSYYTRDVPARFHHSVSVALSVYNLTIVSLIWIFVVQFLGSNPNDAGFKTQFEIVCLLVSQFSMIALLFGPKIYALHINRELNCCGSLKHELRRRMTRTEQSGEDRPAAGLELGVLQDILNRRRLELNDILTSIGQLTVEANERRENVFSLEEEVFYLRKTKKRRSSYIFSEEQIRVNRRSVARAELMVHSGGSQSNLSHMSLHPSQV